MIACFSVPVSTVYLEDSFIKSGVFSVTELVRVSRSKYIAVISKSVVPVTATQTHTGVFQLFFHLSLIRGLLRLKRGGAMMGVT